MKLNFYCIAFMLIALQINAASLFVEAESFQNKGGWVVDQQFMDIMGSSYLMAHGMGKPVEDATSKVVFPKKGTYYVYVRTYNWTSPWSSEKGAGCFNLLVDGQKVSGIIGATGSKWEWQKVGVIRIVNKETQLSLHDLTGFNGRCDALYFTTKESELPPNDIEPLAAFRKKALGLPNNPVLAGSYDLVVVGGGVAGICAAVSAARKGVKVALINDRPVLGGNNSSEIRVHLGGRIEAKPYTQIGNIIKEFGPTRGGNAQPKDYYEDNKKEQIIANEKNITLYPNYRAVSVKMDGNKIASVTAKHIENGKELSFSSPVFSDCTGDGTIGYLAGADFAMGRESKSEFGETTAPDVADKMTMGASVQWYSSDKKTPKSFPLFNYGVKFNAKSAEKVTMGEWTWETGMNYDQIKDFERIRDYGLMVVYSNWSYLKNEYNEGNQYKNRALEWVAYVSGKRESRRLLGDHILTEGDISNYVEYNDASASTTWTIDLHYPDPKNTANFPNAEFKSIAKHINIYPYPIPYRCLYSRNVNNLFMAGRNISVTHVALGTVRVMRTTGMMGEVVGLAASLCKQYGVNPRDIYKTYLGDLKTLMTQGAGKKGLPNNQRYNEGGTLNKKPIQ
jgi:hypothetical protein